MAQPLHPATSMRLVFLLAALASLAPGCSSNDTEIAEITVLDHLTPCVTFEVFDCMIINDGSGTQAFSDRIEGFTYQWGATYRLEVEIVKVRHPVPDASSREVYLREIIEAQPVAPRSEFTLALRGDASLPLLRAAGQGFAMAYGRQITCEDPAVCAALADALRQPAAFDLTLRHPDDPTNELVPLAALAVTAR
jgi:hypothetical protein